MSRYIVQTGNENAGADANLAYTTFFVNDALIAQTQVGAQLVAFMQYLSPAAGTYVRGIERGADAPGPTFPVAFNSALYADIAAADSNILSLTAYGQNYGQGNLAPLGVGIVFSKRTAVPGRSGRGRLTSPWLRTGAVSVLGVALNDNIDFGVLGWNNHLKGDSSASSNLNPYVYPLNSPIVSLTGTARLGKVRTRSA